MNRKYRLYARVDYVLITHMIMGFVQLNQVWRKISIVCQNKVDDKVLCCTTVIFY